MHLIILFTVQNCYISTPLVKHGTRAWCNFNFECQPPSISSANLGGSFEKDVNVYIPNQWRDSCHMHSALDVIKLKLLTGTYILQSKRIRMYKNEIDPKGLLCAKEEENIEHFILNCKSLRKVRNTIVHTSGTNYNFQHTIRNWIWWTISQRKTTTCFGCNSGSENKETLYSQCSRNRTPYWLGACYMYINFISI